MAINQKNIKPGQQDDFLRIQVCCICVSQGGSGSSCL